MLNKTGKNYIQGLGEKSTVLILAVCPRNTDTGSMQLEPMFKRTEVWSPLPVTICDEDGDQQMSNMAFS